MSCRDCDNSIWRQKLGRCRRCILMLAAMSLIAWPLWYLGFRDQPTTVSAIALLFFAGACSGLLVLHLLVAGYRFLRGE
ncbi:DUF3624 domain-containing protein [Shewanella cyperi]|uniref:DUF3624 domain-containing protein n=1 Tax=Shewanella cyperi TaxID=2814292 RepID=A0A975AK02_9GAMM|nr:DUF3624 domain-containing protein [Shewanella cyperi]QSX29640.1 DUF3624 domain-containing protein [Shewanella cyperi]QSX40420.1 DUF3624 domain-containing protein [Shewanella cyperi]